MHKHVPRHDFGGRRDFGGASISASHIKTTTATSTSTALNTLYAQYSTALDAAKVTDSLLALPGAKTSAAFFTFLRANLVLPPTSTYSNMSSSSSTPNLAPSASSNLPIPSPSPLSASQTLSPEDDTASASNPLAGVPDLTTYIVTDPDERIDALKLIGDSIAQQRQASNYALIASPIFFSIWIVVAAFVYEYIYKSKGGDYDDLGKAVTTQVGITMMMLAMVRMLGGGYLTAAEKLNWGFLKAGKDDSEEPDLLLGSKFGQEMIGALVLRIEGEKKRGGGGRVKSGTGKGLIRAWTTKYRYRNKGVGAGMLEEAIKICRERGGREVDIGFAVDHANSLMILPEFFNGHFRKRQRKAVAQLERVLDGTEIKKKR